MNSAKTLTTQHKLLGLAQKGGLGWFERSFPSPQHLHVIDVIDCHRVV